MTIKLYIDYVSQPSRAVYAFCRIAQIPLEIIEIRVIGSEIRSDEYKKINPMRKVPAIVDTQTGLVLAQSHSIMRYLALKYPTHVNQWYPEKDILKRAKIDEYMDFHHTNTRRSGYLIFNSLFAKKIGINDPTFNPEKAKKDVENALTLFSKYYLNSGKFATGDQPTIADLSAYYEFQFLHLLRFDFSKWPRVIEWMSEMGKIKQVKEVNQVFIKLVSKVNPQAKL